MIQKLKYNELMNLDYKVIFDYYDIPLSFIAQVRNINYLFYYISDNEYFIVELNKMLVRKLNEQRNLTNFFKFLLEQDSISIVSFDFEKEDVFYNKLSDVKYDPIKYVPKTETRLEYDYQNNVIIGEDYDLFNYLVFPLETDSICIRISNKTNDHAYSVNIVEKILGIMKNSYNSTKKFYESKDIFTNKSLFVKPFVRGSFKMNFELMKSVEDVWENDISFYPSLRILDDITDEKVKNDLSFLDTDLYKSAFKNVEKLYTIVKDEKLDLNFYNNSIKDSTPIKLCESKEINNKFNDYRGYIEKLENQKMITEKVHYKNAKFLTGSLLYNSTKIKVKDKLIQSKFETSLFKNIKKNGMELNLNQNVDVTIITEKELDDAGEVLSEKNIVEDFNYKVDK